jgi:hypothetical protein
MYSAPPTKCGGPSFSFQVDDVDSCSSGCFGISFRKRSHDGGGTSSNNNSNNNGKAADDDEPTVLIAKAMSNLTLQEREQAYVRNCLPSSPSLRSVGTSRKPTTWRVKPSRISKRPSVVSMRRGSVIISHLGVGFSTSPKRCPMYFPYLGKDLLLMVGRRGWPHE